MSKFKPTSVITFAFAVDSRGTIQNNPNSSYKAIADLIASYPLKGIVFPPDQYVRGAI